MRQQHLYGYLLFVVISLLANPARADVALPNDNDKQQWHMLTDAFAECSAVYNLAATFKSAPESGSTISYRELANNALVAGMMSAEKAGLTDNYLESVYSAKYKHWQGMAKNKSKVGQLFKKGDTCISNFGPYQKLILQTLRSKPKQ